MAKKTRAENPVVGLVQMTCDEQPARNLKKAIARIGEAVAIVSVAATEPEPDAPPDDDLPEG